MEKCFNIAGPCFSADHYMLPALDRMPQIRRLVSRRQYFVIHAPRQTGKTTAIKALVDEINAAGEMYALYCTLETLQNATDPAAANAAIRDLIFDNAHSDPAFPAPPCAREDVPPDYGGIGLAVRTALRTLCREVGKPMVVFFDEADCLAGTVLISFLRQLRDGYVNRDRIPFPVSIALIGMLDMRDYKAQIRPDGESLGQISPFNIITKDLMLRNFTEAEVATLYAQHTDATGQVFEQAALDKVWEFTRGQPWLVNALARECVEEIHHSDYSAPITADDIVAAKETIIRRDPIHLFYLFDMVKHPRVEPFFRDAISGKDLKAETDVLAFKVFKALGLFCFDGAKWNFANSIYAASWERRSSR